MSDTPNEIVQHIPTFVETRQAPPRHVFHTLQELLAVPFVHHWSLDADFHQFSQNERHLIAEQRGGRHWWVVGHLRFPVDGLAEWNHGIHELKDALGVPFEVSGREVQSVCGDVVTMNDGRMFYRADSANAGLPTRLPPIYTIDADGNWGEIPR